MTSIYRKKTFTGLYAKWDSFTPQKYEINLIRSLTHHHYRLCSSGSLLQSDLNDLRKLLLQNSVYKAPSTKRFDLLSSPVFGVKQAATV